MAITIGADPELFVKKDGVFTSAHGLIPGTKEKPYPVHLGAVQVDGMALEFNIDPVQTEQAFCFHINSVMQELQAMVPEYETVVTPVARFTKEYLKLQPPESVRLGCSPDFNAWKMGERNPSPNASLPIRTAAGHVHIGWGEDIDKYSPLHETICCRLVRQLDFFLGLPSLFYDNDTQRRSLYGKAGAYRPKEYGVEYRVLSNAWLQNNKLISWVFRNTKKAISSLREGNDLAEKYSDIQDVINTSDKNIASFIIKAEDIEVPDYA